jgi:hypothetical protein
LVRAVFLQLESGLLSEPPRDPDRPVPGEQDDFVAVIDLFDEDLLKGRASSNR